MLDAENNSAENKYIDEVTRGGKKLDRNYFSHAELLEGGSIRFKMTDKPNTNRGVAEASYPYSMSRESKK
jgi:putative alpha-1,2-mannosidase